jgi:hypothetical protein
MVAIKAVREAKPETAREMERTTKSLSTFHVPRTTLPRGTRMSINLKRSINPSQTPTTNSLQKHNVWRTPQNDLQQDLKISNA